MSKCSRALLLSTTVAAGFGLLLAPATLRGQEIPQQQQAPQQQPQTQQQPARQQQQAQPPSLQQIMQMQRMQMRARIAGAIEQLRTACGEELRNFCGTVTPGEGRLLLCMQAHQDKIGRQCELALMETSRDIGHAVRRVGDLARACWQDIQTHCSGTGGSVTQCMVENRAALSAPCRAMVAAAVPGGLPSAMPPQQAAMIGMPIFSADGMMLGQVTGMKRRADGSLESVEAELGTPMGLGAISVFISPGELRWRGDGVELQMVAEQVRSVLQGQKQ